MWPGLQRRGQYLSPVKSQYNWPSALGVVTASRLDSEQRLHDEREDSVGKHERNGKKPEERHDKPEAESGQRLYKDLQSRLVIVVALQEAFVCIT